jgi:hypothetical protein
MFDNNYLDKYLISFIDIRCITNLASVSRLYNKYIREDDRYLILLKCLPNFINNVFINGNSAVLHWFMMSNPNVDYNPEWLGKAIDHNNADIVHYLVKTQNVEDINALVWCVKNEYMDIIRDMVGNGVKITELCLYPCRSLNMFHYLTELGAKWDGMHISNYCINRCIDIIYYLLDSIDLNTHLFHLLHCAASCGDISLLQHIFDNVQDAMNECYHVLVYAFIFDKFNIIEYMIDKGVDIHYDNYVLFCYICQGCSLDSVRYLVEHGANIHAQDNLPLWNAAYYGNLEVLKYLIEKGANIHADNEKALHAGAANGHLEVVQYLVEQGANIHADNEKALYCGAVNGHLEVVQYLVEQGANIHADNERALCVSIEECYLEITQYLVNIGANLYAHSSYHIVENQYNNDKPIDYKLMINYLESKGLKTTTYLRT